MCNIHVSLETMWLSEQIDNECGLFSVPNGPISVPQQHTRTRHGREKHFLEKHGYAPWLLGCFSLYTESLMCVCVTGSKQIT